jgi:penicillin-insensitive murein endopeptidase
VAFRDRPGHDRDVRRGSALLGLVLAVSALSACAGAGLFTDFSSISLGNSNRGRVRHPARLPARGNGFVVPPRWAERKFQFGTDELVDAAQRAAGRVRERDRRAKVGFADLSSLRGGKSMWHKSHHSGRDIDVLFYSTDEKGKPLPPPDRDMLAYDGEGKPYVARGQKIPYHDPAWESRRFDDKRNWWFLEALASDPSIRLQWVFVSVDLEARLLRWARRNGRPRWIVEYLRVVMQQPGDSLPHDNHFHIRVYCSRADRFHGCEDRGVVWQHEKKAWKYGGPERYDPVLWRQLGIAPDPELVEG